MRAAHPHRCLRVVRALLSPLGAYRRQKRRLRWRNRHRSDPIESLCRQRQRTKRHPNRARVPGVAAARGGGAPVRQASVAVVVVAAAQLPAASFWPMGSPTREPHRPSVYSYLILNLCDIKSGVLYQESDSWILNLLNSEKILLGKTQIYTVPSQPSSGGRRRNSTRRTPR